MLNELYQLHEALPNDLNLYEWHKQMQELPKISPQKPCYKVLIGEQGVCDIYPITALPVGVQKWYTGYGQSFPSFNIKPLHFCSSDVEKRNKEIRGYKKMLPKDSDNFQRFIFDIADNYSEQLNDNAALFKHCLGKAKLIHKWADQDNELPKSLGKLTKRVGDIFNTPEIFCEQLEAIVRQKLSGGDGILSFLPIFLKINKKRPQSREISLLLDVAEQSSSFDFPVQHENTSKWINEYLIKKMEQQQSSSQAAMVDAYGMSAAGADDPKLGIVKLPVLGNVILRSMTKDSPCQRRYGKIEGASFVIGQDARAGFAKAIKWLGDDSHKEKTWVNISPAIKGDKQKEKSTPSKELLFAYPSSAPDLDADISAMFGGEEASATLEESKFAYQAKRVIDALKTVNNKLDSIDIQVFGLRKMDKARTQVTCNEHLSAAQLVECAENWQMGCGNIPPLKIGFFPEGDKKPSWETPHIPLPMQVIWCLNSIWTHLGDRCNRSKAFSGRDGVVLLIGEDVRIQALAKHMLSQFMQRFQPLLLAIGNQQHRGLVFSSKGAKAFVAQARIAPSIAALLLYKTGSKKEDYMQTAAFLVGRLFGLSDQIHHLYCEHVRNKQEPPQLLGNALMGAALESPERALSIYSHRLLPYQAWASTFSSNAKDLEVKGREEKKVRGILKAMGLVSSELTNAELPVRMQDADKAQMILGYLARSK